ncbi:hypothetical protein KKA95_02020 [Patescibacteria group bacterium]|nr:hypothetical protein [Patescibacteria group bacterium]
MKKPSLIFTTLTLFVASLYLAFIQGSLSTATQQNFLTHLVAPTEISPVIYTGLQAKVASFFATLINALMTIFSSNILISIVVLALIVELVLLYPSVNIQLKQKKIHLFHKKLVDRFNSGEIKPSKNKHELELLYAVNEKIHARGAVLVVVQLALFLMTLWGLNLLVQAPVLLRGSWNVFSFNMLSQPVNYGVPLIASLAYLFHSLVKIYYKQREDYIGRTQSRIALLLAFVGTALVYWFAGTFAVALSIYFVTLISFATIRYVVVEQNSAKWGKHARKELIEMLQKAKLLHKSKLEYWSRRWNHLPVVRHINFHLLEEALSMSLGLMLALKVLEILPV